MRLKLIPLMLFVLLASSKAMAVPDYSAEVQSFYNGQLSSTNQHYIASNKKRMEMGNKVLIIREDLGLTYMLDPTEKTYTESSDSLKKMREFQTDSKGAYVGTEEVNGVLANKHENIFQLPWGELKMFDWTDPEGLPIKIQSEDGKILTMFSNIKPGPQPDELFEVPEGYEKIEAPPIAKDRRVRAVKSSR